MDNDRNSLKQVGSVDGGSNCKGCYYLQDRICKKPEGEPNCVISSRLGKCRFTIFVVNNKQEEIDR